MNFFKIINNIDINNISINNIAINNIAINIIENIGAIELLFYLDDLFDVNIFSKSINIFNTKFNIPIKLIQNYQDFIILNYEIYICINDNMMSFNCSHKYYDASSIYKILNLIDNEYKNKNIDNSIYLGNIFLENKFEFSSLINNLLRKK